MKVLYNSKIPWVQVCDTARHRYKPKCIENFQEWLKNENGSKVADLNYMVWIKLILVYDRWQCRISAISVQLYSYVTSVNSVFVSDKIYKKTRHSYIYVACSRPNDWTEWAEFFCRHSSVAGGV